MIRELYKNTGMNSLSTVIDDKIESVKNLNFPAVTIFGSYKESDFGEYYVNGLLYVVSESSAVVKLSHILLLVFRTRITEAP